MLQRILLEWNDVTPMKHFPFVMIFLFWFMQTLRRTVNAPGNGEVRRKCERTVGLSSRVRVMDLWVEGVGRAQRKHLKHPSIDSMKCQNIRHLTTKTTFPYIYTAIDSQSCTSLLWNISSWSVLFAHPLVTLVGQVTSPPHALLPHHFWFLKVEHSECYREEIHLQFFNWTNIIMTQTYHNRIE